jgi:hypothetical protein
MKFTLNAINQLGIYQAGLADKTDLVDWVILDYIFDWQQNPRASFLNGLVWINFKHVIRECPLLGLKDKSSVSKRIKKLRELGLVSTIIRPDDGRLFGKTTDYYFDITRFKQGDTLKNPDCEATNTHAHPVDLNQHPLPEINTPVDLNQHPVDENQHSTVIPRTVIPSNSSFCSELKGSEQVDERKPFISLPLVGGKQYFDIFDDDLFDWAKIYPGVDVVQELRSMLGWLNANRQRQKTSAGIKRFINSWLARAQDKPKAVLGGKYDRGTGSAYEAAILSTDF